MSKEEWGKKRVCPTTDKRFYDLNRDPIISPYTGKVVELDTNKKSTKENDISKPLKQVDIDPISNEEDLASESIILDEDASDIELDDDILNNDDDILDNDDDNSVSLDDIADVPAGNDDD
tara:strand:- start:709 stop:1068 length:360 start_codon:yes stop_codon:yes gene_type:complete